MTASTLHLTPFQVLSGLRKLYHLNDDCPISSAHLLTHFRQNGFADMWMGSLESQLNACLHKLVSEGRITQLHDGYFIPKAFEVPRLDTLVSPWPMTWPTSPEPPFRSNSPHFQPPTPPSRFSPVPSQSSPRFPGLMNLHKRRESEKTSISSMPQRSKSWPFEDGDSGYTVLPDTSTPSSDLFGQRFSNSSIETTDLTTTVSTSTSKTMLTTSTGDEPSSSSTATTTSTVTGSDEMPRKFRLLIMAPSEFEKFEKRNLG